MHWIPAERLWGQSDRRSERSSRHVVFLVRFVPWGLHSRSRWLLKWSIHRRFLQQKNKTFMHSWLCKMSVNGALRADPLRGLAMRKKNLLTSCHIMSEEITADDLTLNVHSEQTMLNMMKPWCWFIAANYVNCPAVEDWLTFSWVQA